MLTFRKSKINVTGVSLIVSHNFMSTFSGRWILTINLVLYVFSMWYLCIIRWLDWPRQTCYTCLSQALFAMPLNLPPSETFMGEMRSESEPQKMDALSLFLLFCFNFISFSFVPPLFFFILFCFCFVKSFTFSLWAGFPVLCGWYSIKRL